MSFNDNKANMTEAEQKNPDHLGGKKVQNNTVLRESAGPIASDSLAAQSESFQSSNRNAKPLGVSGSNSTFANKNTSGAVTLEPTDVASSRPENQEGYPDETAKMGHFTKTDGKNHSIIRDTNLKNYRNTNEGELDDNGNPAPSYVDNVQEGAGLSNEFTKVKGKNLHEIPKDQKFEREGLQPKGGKDERMDEDREAIAKMQQQNAIRDTGGSGVNANSKGQGGSKFDNLNSEESA